MRKFLFFEGYVSKLNSVVRWEPELAEDLVAYHNIDAEEELTHFLSQQIADEIDRDILSRLTRMLNGGERA